MISNRRYINLFLAELCLDPLKELFVKYPRTSKGLKGSQGHDFMLLGACDFYRGSERKNKRVTEGRIKLRRQGMRYDALKPAIFLYW